MKGYQTEQKKLLLQYLSLHADRAFTLEELCAVMTECGVGKSTVYRLVARLCEEGAIRRYAREAGRGYTYQYLHGSDCGRHLHLRCVGCDKVIHVSREVSSLFEATLQKENRFALDGGRTLLFGRCADCDRKERERDGNS